VSRSEKLSDKIPAVGWESEMDSLAVTLQLPPGFQLLWAQGPDAVNGSWVGGWTLYDLFIVLFACLAFAKLFGVQTGALALVAIVLCHNRFNAPFGIWFTLLGLSALLRVLPAGGFGAVVNWLYRGAVLALLVLLFPFIVSEVRNGLYPQTSGYAGNVYPMTTRSSSYQELSVMPQAFDGVADAVRGRADNMLAMQKSMAPAPAMMAGAGMEQMESEGAVEETFVAAKLQEIDPAAVVQIGTGVPTWSWGQASLHWNARVKADETFSLMLLGRKSNLVLGLLRVLAVLLLAVPFLKLLKVGPLFAKTEAVALLLFLALTGRTESGARAIFPGCRASF
jgi:hypothetical protein